MQPWGDPLRPVDVNVQVSFNALQECVRLQAMFSSDTMPVIVQD